MKRLFLALCLVGAAFAAVLDDLGTADQKRLAEIMLEKGWGATMVLTEPDAGSDVGAGRAKATPNEDGSWNITGVKRFITSATHDMSENIMHLVLARPVGIEGVGGPGTKGDARGCSPGAAHGGDIQQSLPTVAFDAGSTLFARFLRIEKKYDLSSLRICLSSGEPLPPLRSG